VSATVRNVLLVAALAAAVAFLPGGGSTADFIGAFLSTAILASFVMIFARLYREHRVAIFGLGDRHRGLLYGAVGAAVLAMAWRSKLFETGGGTLLWFVLVAGAGAAVYAVWRHHQSYGL
jgi:hypothetical protein